MPDTWKPASWATITPRIVAPDVIGLVAFLRAAFDAEGELFAGVHPTSKSVTQ